MPISYEFKTTELFRRFGIGEYVSDIDTVTGDELAGKIERFVGDYSSFSRQLFEGVLSEHQRAKASFDTLDHALDRDVANRSGQDHVKKRKYTVKIAFVLREFPLTSLTFVYRQIEALAQAGHEVSVIAQPSADLSTNAPTAERVRVLYLPGEHRKLERLFSVAALMLRSCVRHPTNILAYLSVLRPRDYLRGRWSARLFAAGVTLSESKAAIRRGLLSLRLQRR